MDHLCQIIFKSSKLFLMKIFKILYIIYVEKNWHCPLAAMFLQRINSVSPKDHLYQIIYKSVQSFLTIIFLNFFVLFVMATRIQN